MNDNPKKNTRLTQKRKRDSSLPSQVQEVLASNLVSTVQSLALILFEAMREPSTPLYYPLLKYGDGRKVVE